MAAKPAPASSAALHLPRIVPILATVALLYLVNQAAPRILPTVLGLLVLYALLANVPRFVALVDSGNAGLSKLVQPAGRAKR